MVHGVSQAEHERVQRGDTLFSIITPACNEAANLPQLYQPTRTTLGEQVRDTLHVEDIAAAWQAADPWAVAGSDLTETVNIGSGVPATHREIGSRSAGSWGVRSV